MIEEVTAELPEELNKDRHPEGLGEDKAGEESELAHQVGEGADPAELLFFHDLPFSGHFPGGVVGAHEGQQNDLEHDDAGDGRAHPDLVVAHLDLGLEFQQHVLLREIGEPLDRFIAPLREQGHEDGKTDQDGELQEDLGPVAEEDLPPPGQEGGKLAEDSGHADCRGRFPASRGRFPASRLFLEGVRFVLVGGRDLEFAGLDVQPAGFFELPVVGFAMFQPRGLPVHAGLHGEGRVDLLGIVHREIVGELERWSVVGHAALVQDQDRVVEFEVGEGVGDRNDGASVVA